MRSLLLIEEYGLGDAVMATPALEALAARYPTAAMTVIGPPPVAELRRPCPVVREVVDSSLFPVGIGSTSFLRRRSFDAAVDLTGKFRTALLAWRTRAGQRIGTPWWRPPWLASTFYTQVVPCRPRRHAVEHKADLARALGADKVPDRLRLWLTHDDEAHAERWLAERALGPADTLLGLHPGGASHGRQWTPAGFAEVCRRLTARGLRCIITGGAQDRPLAARIADQSGAAPFIAAGELPVRASAALLDRCAAVITGDTGPMHLAAAVGTPIVALFGRSDPSWTRPWNAPHVLVSADLDCIPCRGRPRMSSARCRRNLACMTQITPDQVVEALDRLLDQT